MKNPIPELVDDSTFDLLFTNQLIGEIKLRDYLLRRRFKEMRAKKIRAEECITSLQKDYPELQFDTIRKIVQGSPLKHKDPLHFN